MSSSDPFCEFSVDCAIPVEKMNQMYKEWKNIVWLVVFRTAASKIVCTRSAFSLEQNGFLLTASNDLEVDDIHVRRLSEDVFYEATLVKETDYLGIALIKIKSEVKKWVAGRFAQDGRLFAGQTLFQIGNFNFLVGSLLIGKVVFQCLDDGVVVPVEKLSSKNYSSNLERVTLPRWREMGDVLNSGYWNKFDPDQTYFEDRFHPEIQIIHLNNMEAGEGCQGSPLFNLNGEIVGMFAMNCNYVEIGFHLSMLKQFLSRIFGSGDVPHITSQAESICKLGKRKSEQEEGSSKQKKGLSKQE